MNKIDLNKTKPSFDVNKNKAIKQLHSGKHTRVFH